MSCCCCQITTDAPKGYSHVPGETASSGEQLCVCRLRCCILGTCGCLIFIIAILAVILFAGVVPKMAQSSANNSKMILKSVHIYNPTADSIQMDSVIELVNAGSQGGTIDKMTVTISNDNGTIGTMDLPSITVDANTGANFSTQAVLKVQDVANFQFSVKKLLSGHDVEWTMKGKTKIHSKFMKQTVSINMNKKMLLPGGTISQSQSADFTIQKVSKTKLVGGATISFVKNGILTMDLVNVSFLLRDAMNPKIVIGYANISRMHVQPGFNSMNSSTSGATTTIVRQPGVNDKTLSRFFSRFLAGNDTDVIMEGPYNSDGSSSVIDGCLREVITNKGSTKPQSAIAGFETRTSMAGWVNKSNNWTTSPYTYIRGGYSNMRNDLEVDLNVTELSVNLFTHEAIGFHMNLPGAGVSTQICTPSNHLSHLYSGIGMNETHWTKTWLHIPAKSKRSFFVIGEPVWPYSTDFCSVIGLTNCCFAGRVAAHACYANPDMRHNSNGTFSQDFIATYLYSNMTVLIGNEFEVALEYYQEFFPVFPSMEIYTGFPMIIQGENSPPTSMTTPGCQDIWNFTKIINGSIVPVSA